MKHKKIIFLILLNISSVNAIITFEKNWGGYHAQEGRSVGQTNDGGYIICGIDWAPDSGWGDIYLARTDSLGDTLWTRNYGVGINDFGYSVVQTNDGGFIMTGVANSTQLWLLKTNSSGDTLWTKTYGGSGQDMGYSIDLTSDGGFIIVGETWSFGHGSADVWLLKTDSLGDTLWTRTYGGNDSDWGLSVTQTTDHGYIITGCLGWADVYLVKTDSLGDTLWTKTFDGIDTDWGNCVIPTSDGGYVIAGGKQVNGTSCYGDVWLIKTDSLGGLLWDKTYGLANDPYEEAFSISEITSGGYVVVGTTNSFGHGETDVYLLRTDAMGDTLWTRTFGTANDDRGFSVAQTRDSGYVICGNKGVPYYDIYLIKTDTLGYVTGVMEQSINNNTSSIYNPTLVRGQLLFHYDHSYKVFDITGRQIHTVNPAPGIYFIEVDGKIRQKVIKLK